MESFEKIIFKIVTDKKYGLGHYFRCMRLAQEIKKKYKIIFIVDQKNNLETKDFKFIEIYKNKAFENSTNDFILSSKIIKEIRPKAIFIDDKRLDYIWQKKIRKYSRIITLIDDEMNRKMICDYYINYKVYNSKNCNSINKHLNHKAKKLLGTKYWIPNNSIYKRKRTTLKNVIVNFGNSFDFYKIKKFYYNLINDKVLKKINFYFIIGLYSSNFQYLEKGNKIKSNIKIIKNNLDIEDYSYKADLYIGSSGNAIYENSYSNLTSLFFQISKDQSNETQDMERLGHFFKFNLDKINNYNFLIFIKTILKNFKRVNTLINKKNIQLNKKGSQNILEKINL